MFGNDFSGNVCRIMVMGVGGAGNNAVNRMIEAGVKSAEFVAVNTDRQALSLSLVDDENKIAIGERLTKGLGAGSNPEIGAKACDESREEIENALRGVDLLFIAAGMGGGTGTGAAPIVAEIAKKCGCVTVAVVTKPFGFEGAKRRENAKKGIAELSKFADTLVVIPNDKLLEALPADTSIVDALKYADENLRTGICGITDLISTPSLINLDFADVKTILQNKGYAHMGVGRASGENRVVQAVKKAISSPLLETSIEGAKGIIFNVRGGSDLSLGQVNEAADLINSVIDESAMVIFGANIDPEYDGQIEITAIATGFTDKQYPEKEIRRRIFDNAETSEKPERVEKSTKFEPIESSERVEKYETHERPMKAEQPEKPIEKNVVAATEDSETERSARNTEEAYKQPETVKEDKKEVETKDEFDDESAMKDFPPFMKKLFKRNK